MKVNKRQWVCMAVLACAFGQGAWAQSKKEVTFAFQDTLVPYRTAMESGEVEKATGYKINWRMFGGGGDVIRAMASGDVQIGEVGSSPLTAAVTQGQDIKVFFIMEDIAAGEVLVARNGAKIDSVKQLAGKKVGVPFVSTAHYQLMAAMKMEGVDAKSVNVMNMRPPEIAAAWERGDIDAAFIWEPVLSKLKSNGRVLATSGDIGAKGYPTFDALVVNAKWASENDAFMVALVKVLAKANDEYNAGAAKWTAESPQVKAVAKWTKANPQDVPASMGLYKYLSLQDQLSPTWLGGGAAKAMANTAVFLKEQGRVQEVKPDYSAFVTTTYVTKAMAR